MSVTESQQKTLDFLKELCEHVNAERAGGNIALLEHLSTRSPAFKYYFINVHQIKALTTEHFAQQHPQLMAEAELFRQEYEKAMRADENENRLTKVEEGLQALKTEMRAEFQKMMEALTQTAEPSKKGKKSAKVEESEPEEGDGESEA